MISKLILVSISCCLIANNTLNSKERFNPEIDLKLYTGLLQHETKAIVKKLSDTHYQFDHSLNLDEAGRSVYEQRIKGMFPFIENISIKENQCDLFFLENTSEEGVQNGIQIITTNVFNYTTYEIQ